MDKDIKQLIERLREHHNLDLEQDCEDLIYGEAADLRAHQAIKHGE